MWFKKKSVLLAEHHYDTEKSADGSTDMRTASKNYSNNSINSDLPSAADANKYFYLPALGYYYSYGQLNLIGSYGYYWSSSGSPFVAYGAFYLYFYNDKVSVDGTTSYYGKRGDWFD